MGDIMTYGQNFVRGVIVIVLLVLAAGPAAGGDVYVVPISGTIEKGVAAYIIRVMDEAEAEGAAAVLFDIDTPGGALDAALTIRDAIIYSDVMTIALINPRAISAGALISLATDHIVMVEGGTIGAATAVDLQGQKASEKIISYFRNEMKATAEKTGRPPKLAEAMVDEDVDLPGLAPKGKLLTLTTEEALSEKLAEFKVRSDVGETGYAEILEKLGIEGAAVIRTSVNWAEQLVRWLTFPYIASLLMTLGFMGLLFEIQSPGWGVGGTLGLICLGLFFGSHLIVDLADWSEVLIFVIGVVLIFLDIFFVAGFGALAIPGVMLVFASLFLSLMGRTELWTWDSVGQATQPLTVAFVMTGVLGYVMYKFLPKTNAWSHLILQTEERASEGYLAVASYDDLMGSEGEAVTPLRPGGAGVFGDRRLSVTTEGDFLESGTGIRVVEVEGNRVVVRKV